MERTMILSFIQRSEVLIRQIVDGTKYLRVKDGIAALSTSFWLLWVNYIKSDQWPLHFTKGALVKEDAIYDHLTSMEIDVLLIDDLHIIKTRNWILRYAWRSNVHV